MSNVFVETKTKRKVWRSPGRQPGDRALAQERVSIGPQQRFRLVGVALGNFLDPQDISANRLYSR